MSRTCGSSDSVAGVVGDEAVDHALAYVIDDCAQVGFDEVFVQAGGRQPDLAVGVDPLEPGGGERPGADAHGPGGVDADHLEDLRAEPLDERLKQAVLATEVVM